MCYLQKTSPDFKPPLTKAACRQTGRQAILSITMRILWPDLVGTSSKYRVRDLESIGFRVSASGTHTSRTMMLEELEVTLATVPSNATHEAYVSKIIDENVLGKSTQATRKLTAQRLGELYSFDVGVPLFRVFRLYWDRDRRGHRLLALLLALARDPLLRATASGVLEMVPDEAFDRRSMTDAVRSVVGDRLNDNTIDKVVRNAASTWTQSGHLVGRVSKHRRRVNPTPASTAFALFLGYSLGMRGEGLLRSMWIRVLDLSVDEALKMAGDAKRLGLLNMSLGGGVIEISFTRLLTDAEKGVMHGTN